MRKFVFGGSYASFVHIYIVDVYSAPVAYDLMKLSSTATNCIRVRRSSDNTEQDIGFDGNDLDTASLLSFVGVNDGFVTKWYNQGTAGASYDASQTTAGSQPLIVSAGTIETFISGQKSIDFGDSVSNRLLVFGSGALYNNKSYGVGFSVYQNNGTAARNIWAWSTPSANIARFSSYDSFTTAQRHEMRTRRLDGDSVNVLVDTVDFPIVGVGAKLKTDILDWANADAFIRRNGVQVASSTSHGTAGSTSATDSRVVMATGGTSGLGRAFSTNATGHISSVIFFNTDQSANITAIENAINNNYAIY
jgi:hypothetical protein